MVFFGVFHQLNLKLTRKAAKYVKMQHQIEKIKKKASKKFIDDSLMRSANLFFFFFSKNYSTEIFERKGKFLKKKKGKCFNFKCTNLEIKKALIVFFPHISCC